MHSRPGLGIFIYKINFKEGELEKRGKRMVCEEEEFVKPPGTGPHPLHKCIFICFTYSSHLSDCITTLFGKLLKLSNLQTNYDLKMSFLIMSV